MTKTYIFYNGLLVSVWNVLSKYNVLYLTLLYIVNKKKINLLKGNTESTLSRFNKKQPVWNRQCELWPYQSDEGVLNTTTCSTGPIWAIVIITQEQSSLNITSRKARADFILLHFWATVTAGICSWNGARMKGGIKINEPSQRQQEKKKKNCALACN